MNTKHVLSVLLLSPILCPAAVPVPFRGEVRLQGAVANRLNACVRNNVAAKDVRYLTDPFRAKSETHWWRTEFWGKWMQAAQPLAAYAACPLLREKIAESARAIVATQEADGYLGDYAPEFRNRLDWDVWGHKYTLLGLLHAHRATGDAATLAAARRLADHVRSVFGPGKRALNESGHYHGLASCSILEPFVLLYRATRDRAYLDYAGWIVRQLDEGPAAPRLISDAGTPPARKDDDPTRPENLASARKAYEFMSCYQGVLEYFEETGDARLLKAAETAARLVARTEINVCGGAASEEVWYGGAANQSVGYARLQETCVTTTWMRLCGKLLALTGDPFWADELEKSFFNAYLGALAKDGSWFASYTPLVGTRSAGQYHCNMHENCCNANGPRGFLAYLDSYAASRGNDVYLNHFSSARVKAPLASGGAAELEVFSLYPMDVGCVNVIVRTDRPREFTLHVRVPGWSTAGGFRACVGPADLSKPREPVAGAVPGSYLAIRRTWTPGDRLEFSFDMPVTPHVLGDGKGAEARVAFTAGPIVLARDTRFADGDIGEVLRVPECRAEKTRPFSPDVWMTYAVWLPIGLHDERPEAKLGDVVRFCDYASAGNDWSNRTSYRVWLPVQAQRVR